MMLALRSPWLQSFVEEIDWNLIREVMCSALLLFSVLAWGAMQYFFG